MTVRDERPTAGVAHQRFVLNTATNILYLAISTFVMLWYIPFLVTNLGVSVYGLIPLVNSVVAYAAILADTLNMTVLRFLAIDLNKRNWEAATRTFNTALSAILLFSLAMLPVFSAIALFFPHLFHVPAGFETESSLLFGASAAALLITLTASSFTISMVSMHRFDLRNLLLGLSLLTRVGIVVLAFNLTTPHPWHIGLGLIASALVLLVGGWLIWRRLSPELEIRWFQLDRGRLRAMSTLGGWAILIKVGYLLFSSTGLIVVNLAFGAEESGRYGALLLFAELIRNMAEAVGTVLSPAMIARYAVAEGEGLRPLAARAVKFMGLAVALPIGLTIGFAEPLLRTWLGQGFPPSSPLLVLIVAPLTVSCGALPLAYVLTSCNKVQLQGITTLILGFANTALAAGVAFHWRNLGPEGVAIVSLGLFSLNNILLAAYAARAIGLPWYTFYPTLLSGAAHAVLVGSIGYAASQFYRPIGWLSLGAEALAVTVVYVAFLFIASLNDDDRAFISGLLGPAFRRKAPG
jgi:O-antigen/teichoic acid export membrane protein